MGETFKVSEAARRVGTTSKTLRYYEAMRLLPPVARDANGYRHYCTEDLNRLAFIRRAKSLGLTLDEIRDLVTVAEDGWCDRTRAELSQVLVRKIGECTQRIDALVAFRASLEAAARQITAPDEPAVECSCPSCAAFAPSCSCLPVPLDLALGGKE